MSERGGDDDAHEGGTRNDRRRKGSMGDGEASARAEGGGRGEGRIDDDAKARESTRRDGRRAILNAPLTSPHAGESLLSSP
jgi:hypothetical protein